MFIGCHLTSVVSYIFIFACLNILINIQPVTSTKLQPSYPVFGSDFMMMLLFIYSLIDEYFNDTTKLGLQIPVIFLIN